jgi:adenylosuccinate lyase
MDQAHERDGRGWKAEWVALPEVCELTTTAVSLGRRVRDRLEVHPEARARNLAAGGELLASEQVLAGLSRVLGKHAAQSTMAGVMADGSAAARGLVAAVADASGLAESAVRGWATTSALLGAAAMTDDVVRRAEHARSREVVDDG